MKITNANIKNFLRKTFRFGLFIPFSNIVLTYWQRKIPDKLLQFITRKRNVKIQNYLRDIVSKAIADNRPVPVPNITVDNAIWVCWLQGADAMPPVTRICYDSICKHAKGHPVILLTQDNFHDYVMMPQNIERLYTLGKIKPAHYADIMRVNLLAQQGGLWLDATMWLASPIDSAIFKMPFWSIHTPNDGYFVSQCRWAVFALAAKRHNLLMVAVARCFDEYLKQTDTFIDYFMFDQFIDMLQQQSPELHSMIEAIPINNINVHKLDHLLTTIFNEDEYHRITAGTQLFKLSYKSHTAEQLDDIPDNYYHYLAATL